MRKILASILVLAMALASFSMVAFAAPSTDVYFNADGVTAVTATEDTYTVEVYYNPASHAVNYDGVYYIGAFSVETAVTDATSVTTAATIANLSNSLTNNNKIMFNTSGDSAELTGAVKVADITITRAEGAKTSVLTLSNAVSGDYDGSYVPTSGSLTITWPSNDPDPLPEPAEKLPTTFEANGETYNAVNTTVTVADYAGATSGNVIATYWKNGVTELLTKSIPFSTAAGTANITGTAGSASFAVAITNVPETVVITAIDIAF